VVNMCVNVIKVSVYLQVRHHRYQQNRASSCVISEGSAYCRKTKKSMSNRNGN
jgi:hypothetical protein